MRIELICLQLLPFLLRRSQSGSRIPWLIYWVTWSFSNFPNAGLSLVESSWIELSFSGKIGAKISLLEANGVYSSIIAAYSFETLFSPPNLFFLILFSSLDILYKDKSPLIK